MQQADQQLAPASEVSLYHLALQIRASYEGMLIALPAEHWPSCRDANATELAGNLLRLARILNPRQVATSKRGVIRAT